MSAAQHAGLAPDPSALSYAYGHDDLLLGFFESGLAGTPDFFIVSARFRHRFLAGYSLNAVYLLGLRSTDLKLREMKTYVAFAPKTKEMTKKKVPKKSAFIFHNISPRGVAVFLFGWAGWKGESVAA